MDQHAYSYAIDHHPLCFLKDLKSGFVEGCVRERVLRIIVDEYVCTFLSNGHFFKVVHGVDLVLVDGEGTRVIARLTTEAVKDRFLNCFIRDSCYEVSDFLITDGGEGFHPNKKLELLNHLYIAHYSDDLLTDIYCVVRYISEVRTRKDQGYKEKQLEIILQTTDRDTGNVGHIICFLNGPWVEYVKRDFKRLGMNQHVFVVVTYVYSKSPSNIGIPIVSSYLDATEVLMDPNYPEVQNLKLEVEA